MLSSFASVLLVSAYVPSAGEAEPGSYGMLLLYALVALGFSFFCSIAEAVLLSVSPSYIATLGKSGKRSAQRLRDMKANVDRPLAAILSLNTIAHTVGAAGVGAEAAGIWGSSAVGYASAVMTLLILILSEIIPKTIGAVYWRQLAPLTAQLIQLLIWALYPLVWLSEQLTKLISGGKKHEVVTRQELAATAALSSKTGELRTEEHRILTNLLRFDSLTVENIMTPRTVMFCFPEDWTVGELLERHPSLPVSRIPVYRETIDDVTGFVLKADVLLAQANDQFETSLLDLHRAIKAIPATASLMQAFELLLDDREHLALVVDEYGGTDGLVTMEDLIETLLGLEIVDEADRHTDMQRLARKKWEERMAEVGIDIRGSESSQGGENTHKQG